MKIAVVGAGAMGSLIAGSLAKKQQEVLLIGRPDQIKAIQNNKLRIRNDQEFEDVAVKTAFKLDRECDLVIFAVPYPDLEFAYQANHFFMENCYMLSIQAGVQGANILSCHFDPDKILSSLITFGARRLSPTEICLDYHGEWLIGKPFVTNDELTFEVADVLGQAFKTEVSFDISAMLWLKLLWDFRLALPALVNKPQEEVFGDLDFCRLYLMLLAEGFDIVQKGLVPLASLPSLSSEQMQKWATMDPEQGAQEIQAHFSQAPEARGAGIILEQVRRQRSSEIDFINGEVTHAADSMRIETPLNSRIVRMIHQIEETRRYFEPAEIKEAFGLN